jgi:hypothetical protein
MSRQGHRVVFATLTEADYQRVRAYLGDQSVNDYMRGLISADLEDAGDEPLSVWVPRARTRTRTPLVHGRLSSYSNGLCRCELCRKAGTDYRRQWMAKGACATL